MPHVTRPFVRPSAGGHGVRTGAEQIYGVDTRTRNSGGGGGGSSSSAEVVCHAARATMGARDVLDR